MREHTFFSEALGNFSQIVHILDKKTNLYKANKAEMNPYSLFEHNAVKLKIEAKKSLVNTQTHAV